MFFSACNENRQSSGEARSSDSAATNSKDGDIAVVIKHDSVTLTPQIDMLHEFLSRNAGEDESYIRKYCTQNVINKLHDAYTAEFDDTTETLATWAINGRWDSSVATLDTIMPFGADTYIARFDIQSDNASSPDGCSEMEYRLTKESNSWKVDDYRQHKLSTPF